MLVCSARVSLDAQRAKDLREWAQRDLDWNYVLGLARRDGTRALLYTHLEGLCPEAVPPLIRSQLREHFHANLRANMLLTGELLKLLRLLEARGILAIPFKGPSLTALA